jgi:hypothetical protein
VGTEKSIWFTGAEARAEDTAFIEKSDAPATFVRLVKDAEATVTYVENKALMYTGVYQVGRDTIEFNPNHRDFSTSVEERARFRWHEVIHRADIQKYFSWLNTDFVLATNKAKAQVGNVVAVIGGINVTVFDKVLEETKALPIEDKRAVHDILSALRQGKNGGLVWYHNEEYWKEKERHYAYGDFFKHRDIRFDERKRA